MKRGSEKSCFEGMKGLEKECVFDEIFNYILTVDRYFYDLEWKAKRQ